MRIYLLIVLGFYIEFAVAQKQKVDSETYNYWPTLEFLSFRSDGKYVVYTINRNQGDQKTIVQATSGKWKKELPEILNNVQFTADKRSLLFLASKNNLGILNLRTGYIKYISDVDFYGLQKYQKREFLWYRKSDGAMTFIFDGVHREKAFKLNGIAQWKFSEDGNILILSRIDKQNNNQRSLIWYDIEKEDSKIIWKGFDDPKFVFDTQNGCLAVKEGSSIRIFKAGQLVKNFMVDNLADIERFTRDGKKLLVRQVEKATIKPIIDAVEVWSYTDIKLQSEQESEIIEKDHLAIVDLDSYRIIESLANNETLLFPGLKSMPDSLALIRVSSNSLETWNKLIVNRWYLKSLNNNGRGYLSFLDNNATVQWSYSGKFLLYFDLKKHCYFSYEIASGKIRNLTPGMHIDWNDTYRDDMAMGIPRGFNKAIWLSNDDAVFIYDKYDIWKLDPLCKKKPINFTNGNGESQKVIFSLVLNGNEDINTSQSQELYISAFDLRNKNNGFYVKQLNSPENPRLLSMGAYIYDTNIGGSYVPDKSNFHPVKAKNATIYLVKRMSATEAPNFYSTSDFIKFVKLSAVNPQAKYNWYTTELHSWVSLNGELIQGILYKPENFDPSKKYPVILNFYERKSDALNVFIKPEPLCSGCNINIPTFVSQEYLVFSPDIYYKVGDPMQGTYNSVISAAHYLATLPFIDSNKMGIQGCSFGGIQTNYLITHTNIFRAAISASGVSDLISGYGSIDGRGSSLQTFYENGVPRMGESLWERPETYLNNSAIFQANRVKTPLLLMHTKDDGLCLYPNILEFFTGLRRLGKRAWLLAYSNANHGIIGKDAIDFNTRMLQFFDHYLKGKPSPVWMTQGIPASRKGIDNGFEYDTEISTPGDGLLTPEEQEKSNNLSNRPSVTIHIK